jgi:DNA mismatch endonuclease, patch repair protein
MAKQDSPDLGKSWASTPGVRRRMQLQRERDTVPEIALRRELHRRGLRYRLDRAIVPGTKRRRVDIVFPSPRVAVFVDGCFWHGCEQHRRALPTVNDWYWPEKLATNRRRDQDTDQRLSDAGWVVVRIWEHEDVVTAADVVERAVRARRSARGSHD